MSEKNLREHWKVVCRRCAATEEGSDDEIPLRLHGRMEKGQWQHYVGNAFTASEWCGPVEEEALHPGPSREELRERGLKLGEREIGNLEGNLRLIKAHGGSYSHIRITEGWADAVADLLHDWRILALLPTSRPDAGLPEWVIAQWDATIANRPLVNRYRRFLDDIWRQVYRRVSNGEELPCIKADEAEIAKAHAAPAAPRCPVEHGAEREMELQWVCETCGHREDAGATTPVEGWVSVGERLPEVVTDADGSGVNCVLVYARDGFECGSDIQVVNTVWLKNNTNWERMTHWMPLPDPPLPRCGGVHAGECP